MGALSCCNHVSHSQGSVSTQNLRLNRKSLMLKIPWQRENGMDLLVFWVYYFLGGAEEDFDGEERRCVAWHCVAP